MAQIREGARASWAPLLDAAVPGLQALPGVRLPSLPRMANFALWSTACGATLWPAGSFAHAYDANRKTALSRRTQWQFASRRLSHEAVKYASAVANGICRTPGLLFWVGSRSTIADDADGADGIFRETRASGLLCFRLGLHEWTQSRFRASEETYCARRKWPARTRGFFGQPVP